MSPGRLTAVWSVSKIQFFLEILSLQFSDFVHVIAIKSLYRLMSVSLPGTVYCGVYRRLKIWVVEKVPISLSN